MLVLSGPAGTAVIAGRGVPDLSEIQAALATVSERAAIGGIRIRQDQIATFFVPHRTALVSLELHRKQLPRLFRFREAS